MKDMFKLRDGPIDWYFCDPWAVAAASAFFRFFFREK